MARHNIIDGPSKFDLMVSLFVGDSVHRHDVKFSFQEDSEASIVINDVKRESGNGETWFIIGYCEHKKVKGYYSTQTRKGWLEIEDF